MRIANIQVFDNIITGNGTWYSGTQFNRVIGQANYFAVQTYATSVSGGSPTLTVESEMSSDSVNWVATGNTEINAQAINTTPVQAGASPILTGNGLAAFVRLKITMGGSTPQCRLKLYVTCRATAVDAGSPR